MGYSLVRQFGYVRVYRLDPALHGGVQSLVAKSGLDIDADGCPKAYAPPGSGLPALDRLSDGGWPNDWYGGPRDKGGRFIVQGKDDPAPGYIVSATSWSDPNLPETVQRKYVDSASVPYLVIPGNCPNFRLSSIGTAYRPHIGKYAHFVVADTGPRTHYGEGSIALANELDIPSSALTGGVSDGVFTILYPTSTLVFGDWDAIAVMGEDLFSQWGGQDKADAVIATLYG
jgi:hypothetical protein